MVAMLDYSSRSLVTSFERNERKPSTEISIKIADIFGLTTNQLLRDELEVDC